MEGKREEGSFKGEHCAVYASQRVRGSDEKKRVMGREGEW